MRYMFGLRMQEYKEENINPYNLSDELKKEIIKRLSGMILEQWDDLVAIEQKDDDTVAYEIYVEKPCYEEDAS